MSWYICVDCWDAGRSECVELNQHGRCEVCGSDRVIYDFEKRCGHGDETEGLAQSGVAQEPPQGNRRE